MVRRISDNDVLSAEELKKIAAVISKKENIQLFDIVDKEKVDIIKKELRIKGFDVKTEPQGDKVKVYAVMPERVKFTEAMESNSFKKLAWGRYCFQKEGMIGMFKYDFDDGSIWKVIADPQTGEEYLAKEVSDDEEEIVRVKVATNEKFAFVNENNIDTIISLLYGDVNNILLKDITAQNDIKSHFYNMLNKKLEKVIEDTIINNHFIQSPNHIADVKGVIKTAIDNKQLNSHITLSKIISEYNDQIINEAGKMKKLF